MSERSKPRRQLPAIPVPASTPETQPVETPVPPTTFYSANPIPSRTPVPISPPPLPARPQSIIGTSHTSVVSDPTYREPELVTDDKNTNWVDQNNVGWSDAIETPWDQPNTTTGWSEVQQSWPAHDGWNREWGGAMTAQKVDIDGRVQDEESNWWSKDRKSRPGPGMLPTMLETLIHDPEHSLFSVSTTMPDIKPRSRLSDSSSLPSPLPQPTPDEVRFAVPHPNAYYCRKHNSWVLLLWKSSSVEPPLAKSYQGPPLPDLVRRRQTSSCIGEGSQPFGQMNKTHHFHHYKKAIDASKLNPPFRRNDWDPRSKKQRRRQGHLFKGSNASVSSLADEEIEEEGELVDLYVCCQCSFYCVVSESIPGIVPVEYLDKLTTQKQQNPQVGKSSEVSVLIAWETILMYVPGKACHELS